MNYSILTNQHNLGTVSAIEKTIGTVGHWRCGVLYEPDFEAVRRALPFKWRKAFDRRLGVWYDKSDNQYPAFVKLFNRRGKFITTLYMQPLKD